MAEAMRKEQRARAEIVGFVDAISGETIYGWALNRTDPAERLTVTFRLGDEEIGATTADQEREDLRANKVGDGRYAFTFRIPPERMAELDTLEVVARSPGGGATARLAMATPAAAGAAVSLGDVHDALRRLVHSQRLLHRTLQGGLEGLQHAASGTVVEELRAAQNTVADQVRGLEAVVVRLDGVVQELGASVKRAQRRSSDPSTLTLLLFVTLGVAGCLGLELVRLLF
jgi:hypothetical protein